MNRKELFHSLVERKYPPEFGRVHCGLEGGGCCNCDRILECKKVYNNPDWACPRNFFEVAGGCLSMFELDNTLIAFVMAGGKHDSK